MKNRLQKEIGRIAKAMLKKERTDKEYCELYAVRQAFTCRLILIWQHRPPMLYCLERFNLYQRK
jgi:hypothetical protein